MLCAPPSLRLGVCFCVVLAAAGCAVDRWGRGAADGGESLDIGESDLGLDGEVDANVCAIGTVDLDGDPNNGCECHISAENCNGLDDDCDPATADGAADPSLGTPCDGIDRDRCAEGVFQCAGGVRSCTDSSPDSRETCGNGIDDDCDGLVDEPDDAVDTRVFAADADGDGHGTGVGSIRACSAPAGFIVGPIDDCDDTRADIYLGAPETCDGHDDDCNGTIDDGTAMCPCPIFRRGADTYLFCKTSENYGAAEARCVASGYQLATIDDAAESAWVQATAHALAATDTWWIGLNDVATEGTYVWTSGSASTFRQWHSGEPNNAGDEDCVEVNAWDADAWNDTACGNGNFPVCEAP